MYIQAHRSSLIAGDPIHVFSFGKVDPTCDLFSLQVVSLDDPPEKIRRVFVGQFSVRKGCQLEKSDKVDLRCICVAHQVR